MVSRLKSRTASRENVERSDKDHGSKREALPLDPKARLSARVALALALVAAALWTAADFLPALIWASILAITVWPIHLWFASTIIGRRAGFAALLSTACIGLLLFLPIALATYQIAQQSDILFAWIKQARESGIQVPEWIARLPVAADATQHWWRENLTEPRAAAAWLQSVNADKAAELVKTFGGQLLHRAFMFLVSMLALFFLLRDGYAIAQRVLVTADRIFGDPGEGLAEKLVAAIRGTVNGTVMVAITEGLLIGLAYLIAGVPNPLLFIVLTIAFAMLPFGAWAAFTLAALTLLFTGASAGAALGVFAWGAIVMLTGDHFVGPTLIGNAARLPFLFAFVGIFGGIASFGLVGLFVGPVIMAALLTVWREWVMRT
jgi:predicted PurR-regulated permease PerM